MKIYEARIGRGMEAELGEDEATELSRFPDELWHLERLVGDLSISSR